MTILMQSCNANHNNHLERIRFLHQKIGILVSSNYDVADECNLSCEGCLYFAGLDYKKREPVNAAAWDSFFSKEAERGVNFGYFAGAEPSLVPYVLLGAAKHIRHGVIHTNGIKRISEDIRYRIHISLWGDQTDNKTYRGADNSIKALRNYQGDSRAIAVYTINRQNISNIVPVSEMCAAHGIPITFSYYSPTDDYLARLNGTQLANSKYFRVHSEDDVIALGEKDFVRARDEIGNAKSKLPDDVWYSLEYDHWITSPASLYQLDENGVATDCGNRVAKKFHHYNVDLSRNTGKCCSPNIDCKSCRAYTNGYATLLSRFNQLRKNEKSLGMWLNTWELWMRLFLLPEKITSSEILTMK